MSVHLYGLDKLKEVWKPVYGFERLYEVSNKGNVKSLYRYKKRLVPFKQKNGYLSITIYKDGKEYFKLVHRLVALSFIPNPSNKKQVNHIDENKTNNCVDNLEWMTPKENMNYGTARERTNKSQGQSVIQMDQFGNIIGHFDTENEAAILSGANRYKISAVINGHRNLAGGYKWMKAGE